jgi:hypothetical protein
MGASTDAREQRRVVDERDGLLGGSSLRTFAVGDVIMLRPQVAPASLRDVSSAKMAALRVAPTCITRMVSPTVAALDPTFLPPLPLRAGEHVANVANLIQLPRSTPLRVFDEAINDASVGAHALSRIQRVPPHYTAHCARVCARACVRVRVHVRPLRHTATHTTNEHKPVRPAQNARHTHTHTHTHTHFVSNSHTEQNSHHTQDTNTL